MRHCELLKERERLERIRVGIATAMLIEAHVPKEAGELWQPWDVFPDLRPPESETDDGAQGILNMFRLMAASQKVQH